MRNKKLKTLAKGWVNALMKHILKPNTWKIDKKYSDAMEERMKLAVKMIDFDFSSVMDLGCGLQKLKKLLPENIEYYGVDLHQHIESTIVKDFNNKEFFFKPVDVCFALGIFEYIYDIKSFIKNISTTCNYLVCSYYIKENRLRETPLTVNNFSEKEIIKLIEKNNFTLVKKFLPENQESVIFVFKKFK